MIKEPNLGHSLNFLFWNTLTQLLLIYIYIYIYIYISTPHQFRPFQVGHVFYNSSYKNNLLLSHPLLSHNFKFLIPSVLKSGVKIFKYFQNQKYSYAWGLEIVGSKAKKEKEKEKRT